jgi:hypothetical protein
MRTRRLLGASLTTVLTVGLVGAATPTATAGDNDKSEWDDRRVVQTPGAEGGDLHVLANRGKMTTVVRELGADTDAWRIRVSTDGGLKFGPPLTGPRDVQRFRYDRSQLRDTTYATYEHDGRLFAAEADAERSIALTMPTNLAAAGSEVAKVVAGGGDSDDALVTQGGTWHQHFGPVGGADPETTPNDPVEGSHWVSYPDPNVDGVPGNAGEDYAFTVERGLLLVFWNADNGDLRFAAREAAKTDAAFSAPQTIATGGEKYVDFVETANGGRLVTQGADGSVTLWQHDVTTDATAFAEVSELAGPVTSGDPIAEPQVAVDPLHATLTVGWKEPRVKGGGLVLWQEGRPESTYLERGNLVPGTRDSSGWQLVTSPKGSLTVAFRRDVDNAVVRVKHLPAGKAKWTDGVRLISPKPITGSSAAWALGAANNAQDVRVVVNDTVGVYGFRFDAPAPYTKVTKPVRRTQKVTTYRIGWNTSWQFADDWQVRMRKDKKRGYGPWKQVSVADGAQTKMVNRARGVTWCYQAKAFFDDGQVTRWSKQRCVTVRR